MISKKESAPCSTFKQSSKSPTPSAPLDERFAYWRDRGCLYAESQLSNGVSARALVATLQRWLQTLVAVELDETLDAFENPDRARLRLEVRRTYLSAALSAALAAGGLQIGWPNDEDATLGLTPRAPAVDLDRRC